jgi:hypothetical protein
MATVYFFYKIKGSFFIYTLTTLGYFFQSYSNLNPETMRNEPRYPPGKPETAYSNNCNNILPGIALTTRGELIILEILE